METTTTKSLFEAKPLLYEYTALAPAISEQTLKLHHDKHYVGYVTNLNRLANGTQYAAMPLKDVVISASGSLFNNAAQAWNHEFYFDQFSTTPKSEPSGTLAIAINNSFGSFEEFCSLMETSAIQLFGSGWVWLVVDKDGSLKVVNESNAGNPLTMGQHPIMTIDVWEHAYYVDYENRRAESIESFWRIVDWGVIESRYVAVY